MYVEEEVRLEEETRDLTAFGDRRGRSGGEEPQHLKCDSRHGSTFLNIYLRCSCGVVFDASFLLLHGRDIARPKQVTIAVIFTDFHDSLLNIPLSFPWQLPDNTWRHEMNALRATLRWYQEQQLGGHICQAPKMVCRASAGFGLTAAVHSAAVVPRQREMWLVHAMWPVSCPQPPFFLSVSQSSLVAIVLAAWVGLGIPRFVSVSNSIHF